MDVSLDEIIKRNRLSNLKNRRRGGGDKKPVAPVGIKTRVGAGKTTGGGGSGGGAVRKPQRTGAVKKKKVSDLRLLIGGKPSAAAATPASLLRDAREKLNRSARHKLVSLTHLAMRRGRRNALTSPSTGGRRKLDSGKPAYMDIEEARLKRRSSGGSLLYRTVDNDAGYGRSEYRTTSSRSLHPLATVNRPNPVPLLPEPWHQQPAVQDLTRYQPVTRTFNQNDVWLQPQIPRRSQGMASNGMKRRLDRDEDQHQHNSAGIGGYRIVVSNLQPSVTHEDIKELFEDIGSLFSSRVVRPGTAEVVYRSMEDAVKAVDTYHNRQLDGQPMKCLLVTTSVETMRGIERSRLSDFSNMGRIQSKGSVIPDLHAIHKALFN